VIRRFTGSVVVAGSVALLIAACQGSPGSPSAAGPSSAGGTLPASTVAPSVQTSAAPSASAVAAIPFTYRIPAGWQDMPPAALRAQLDAALSSGGVSGDIRDAWTWGRDEVDKGHVKAIVIGPSKIHPWTASVIMLVVDPPPSLEAGAADVVAAMPSQFPRLSFAPVDLPIGDALTASATFSPAGGSPSREVLVFTLLPDGRLLWLDAAAPATDDDFEQLVETFAESLAASS
jgi:hypothetical protein